MAKKRYKHNERLLPDQNVPHGVIILAIIAYLGEKDIPTKDILYFWSDIVNMTSPHTVLPHYLFRLRKECYIETKRKREGSYHSITERGWRRLIYHYRKGNIPKWLLDGVEDVYKEYDEYFREIEQYRKSM